MAFPTGWGRRVALTIDAAQVAGTGSHSNVPVLVHLDSVPVEAVDAGSNSALNGGGDLRFSSDSAGSTQLACDVVSYVTNATAGSRKCVVWVKVPSVSGTVNTTLYMWYNKTGETQPAVTDTYGRNAVWSDYQYVSHDGATDSSGNHTITQTSITTATDKWGATCAVTNGTSSYGRASVTYDNTKPYYLSLWYKAASEGGSLFGIYDDDSNGRAAVNNTAAAGFGNVNFIDRGNGGGFGTAVGPTTLADPAVWTYIVGVASSSTSIVLYMDAVAGTAVNPNSPAQTNVRLSYGCNDASSPSSFIAGNFSEMRYRRTSVSADWITTEYNNQNNPSAFLSSGTPETPAGGGGTALTVQGLIQSVTLGQPSLSQHNILSANDAVQSQLIDVPSLTQHNLLTAANATQVQQIDSPTLTQAHIITPADVTQAQLIDGPSLTQYNLLTVSGATQAQLIDNIALVIGGSLAVDAVNQSQSIEQPGLTQHHLLSINDILQAQSLGNVSLVEQGDLDAHDVQQAQLIDAITLTQHHSLTVQALLQNQTIDALGILKQSLAVHDIDQAQSLDNAALLQAHVLSVGNLTQQQLIDAVAFGGAVIGYLNGEIVIAALYDGEIQITKLYDGNIRIN